MEVLMMQFVYDDASSCSIAVLSLLLYVRLECCGVIIIMLIQMGAIAHRIVILHVLYEFVY